MEKKTEGATILKYLVKHILYRLHLAEWLNRRLFRAAYSTNQNANAAYAAAHPAIVLPSDEDLFETYQLDYRKFIEDGKLAAREIVQWTKPYLSSDEPAILDWGCGVGRIIRHMPALLPNAVLYGCDTSEPMIEWDRKHYTNITFSVTDHFTPTLYAPCFFDLVYGFSVLTHIDASMQQSWLKELHRVLSRNGILLITTQGKKFYRQLLPGEKRTLLRNGIFTRSYAREGSRMMSSYHEPAHFKKLLSVYFDILEFHDGAVDQTKAGGHDLWILRRK